MADSTAVLFQIYVPSSSMRVNIKYLDWFYFITSSFALKYILLTKAKSLSKMQHKFVFVFTRGTILIMCIRKQYTYQ
jgi:hypothetical protein